MTERTLTVDSRSHPSGATVLTVSGELDHHTAGQLRAAVEGATYPPAGTVLDCTGLGYCDSTGITVLVTAYHRAQAAGSPLVLAGLSADLLRVFRIVGLDQIFSYRPTVGEALEALAP
ncbi:STAS domain-containing protein [Streptomyces sp. ODS05-4]|uniref:STAS domain-containing protein n=1 Tax=Streptomyces sp. ODS05-4 TaxID=2944939 RepID=UPI00210D02DE|nr:STAS domain-containing protein [Streptomyces sp. ODS05-4]